MPISLSDIMVSQAFEFEGHYYMKIEIACAKLEVSYLTPGLRPIVNLHSGTVRVIPRSTDVWPLQSKVQLRQGHTHEELNGEKL
jgi:hypothetical protein